MPQLLGNTKSIFRLFLLGFFALLMVMSRTYPEESRLFPELLGGITIILIMVSFIRDFTKEKKREQIEQPEIPSSDFWEEQKRRIKEVEKKSEDAGYEVLEEGLRKKRLRQSVVIILISLGIGYLGGILLVVPFCYITFGMLHGQKRETLKYIIIAAGVTLLTYLCFTCFMHVPLLDGILWELS
jgi:hypothetical protein